MKEIKITPRLRAVASFVKKCKTVADIGTDHGFIPVYLIQNGLCENAIASDINIGPLNSAVKTAQTHGVSDKIEFVHAPGLEGISDGAADTVIIAGMGGETIIGILSEAEWLKAHRTHVILQPQSKLENLADFLSDNGYEVLGAKLVKDAGRLYIVLSISYTGSTDKSGLYFADMLKNDELFSEYLTGIAKQLTLRLKGLENANNADEAELEKCRYELGLLNKMLLEAESDGNCK